MNYTPIQRLTLKGMDNQSLINLIRQTVANFPDTSLIITPRIDQSGQAYYWTGLRYGTTELDFTLLLNREIEAFILCFLFPHKGQGRFDRHQRLHTRPDHDKEHQLAPVPHVQTPRILTADTGLHQMQQRPHIPEPQTDIPIRKHRLLTGD